MSFEMDGEAQDPFAEADEEASPDEESSQQEAGGGDAVTVESDPNTDASQSRSEPRSQSQQAGGSRVHQEPEEDLGVTVDDLTVGEPVEPAIIAQALTDDRYRRESPPVPYAVWRDNVSIGRTKKTFDINDDLDDLVKQAADEFENRFDTDIYKADVRELAMAYGLMHIEELFAMASEWGVEYDK